MSKKILLADDSVTIQKVVELTFHEEDFEVMIVGNGLEALEKIKGNRPDIILADISMPGLNGIDLCEKLKNNPEYKHIPIILLINSFEEFDRKKGDKIGVNGYIEKPFESHDLVDMVQSLTEKKEVELEEEREDNEDEEEAEAISIDKDRKTLLMEDDEKDEEPPISPSEALELELINEEEQRKEVIEETIAEEPDETEKTKEDDMLADEQIEVTEITGEEISLQEIQEEEEPEKEEAIERIDEVEEIFKEKEKKEKEISEEALEEVPPIVEEPEKPEPVLEKTSDETAEITDKHDAPAIDDKKEIDLEGLDRSLGKYLRILIEESFKKSIEKMAPKINEIVENITKEIVPEIAESIIKKEIEKIKGDSDR